VHKRAPGHRDGPAERRPELTLTIEVIEKGQRVGEPAGRHQDVR